MNTTSKPIIPAQLRGLDHFKGQKDMVWINTFGMNLQISTVEKNGQNNDVVLLAFASRDLDVRVKDPSLLRLDEFRFLQDAIKCYIYESFIKFLACIDTVQIDTDRICAIYYLEDLKKRHGENIDMNLFFRAVNNFKFPE